MPHNLTTSPFPVPRVCRTPPPLLATSRKAAVAMLARMKDAITVQEEVLLKEQRILEAKLRRAVFKSMLPVPARNQSGRPASAPPAGRSLRTRTPAGSLLASTSASAKEVEVDIDPRWVDVVLNTNVMNFVGWRALGRFRAVSKVHDQSATFFFIFSSFCFPSPEIDACTTMRLFTRRSFSPSLPLLFQRPGMQS